MGPTTIIPVRSPTLAAAAGGTGKPRMVTATRGADQRAVPVAAHMPMTVRIARDFAGRGEEGDDLIQVALLELVKAAGRYDPARGVDFARYAYPLHRRRTEKHLRDNEWTLYITRRVQELYLQTSRAIPRLTQTPGRTPTITDLATHLHLT